MGGWRLVADPFSPQRNRQFKVQRHLVMKNRNNLLVDISKCNSFSMQYFNMDIMDIIEVSLPLSLSLSLRVWSVVVVPSVHGLRLPCLL